MTDANGTRAEASGRPVLVVLEGLDGIGKSTVASRLAARLGARLLSTPGDDFAHMRADLDRLYAGAPAARTLFYASTVLLAAARARELLDRGVAVVLDRYLLSTLSYSRSPEVNEALVRLGPELPRPDLTVYLHAPLAVRAERMRGRQVRTGCDVDSLDRDGELDRAHRHFASLPMAGAAVGRFVQIDASRASPEELVARIVELLPSCRNEG